MPLNISKMHSSKVLFHLWKSQGGIIWGHLMLAWHEALDDQRCEREHYRDAKVTHMSSPKQGTSFELHHATARAPLRKKFY